MNFKPQDLVGKTIYRGSSYAPTRGQNNPQGYINRGLNNKKQGPFGGVSRFGSTGRSETRSGLAKQALDRMLSQGGRNTNPIPPFEPPTQDNRNTNPIPPFQPPTQENRNTNPIPPFQPPVGMPVRPWLHINNTGQITLPVKSRRLFKAKQKATEDFIAQILAKGLGNG